MNLQEYQKLTSRTNTDLGSKAINAAHVTLGIVGEYGEVIDEYMPNQLYDAPDNTENIKKEVGDAFWYCSELANLFDIKLEITKTVDDGIYALKSIEVISENIKKFLAYQKEPSIALLTKHLNNIVFELNSICEDSNISLGDVLEANITKLQKRFPESFSAELAIAKGDENLLH